MKKLFSLAIAASCLLANFINAEQTLSIIKPDAVKNHHIGDIIARFESEKIDVVGLKMTRLSKKRAMKFYAEHKDKPFYQDLVNFMTSGPVVAIVLEGNGVIAKNRQIMGTTNPKESQENSLRAKFATSITENAVHGSDSVEAAQREISFFFKPNEIFTPGK